MSIKLRLIAKTPQEWQKGLMHSKPLDKNEIALFISETEKDTSRGFWNKNVKYPIYVSFYDKNFKLINTEELAANSTSSVYSKKPYKYVIEYGK